jgi:hypothetical protein
MSEIRQVEAIHHIEQAIRDIPQYTALFYTPDKRAWGCD